MPTSGQLGKITQSGMFAGGMAVSNGVQSVTGSNVNNTDPRNPIIIPSPGAPSFTKFSGTTPAIDLAATQIMTVPVDVDFNFYMEIIFSGENVDNRTFLRRQLRAKRIGTAAPIVVGAYGVIGNDASDAVFSGVIPGLSSSITGNNVNVIFTNPAAGSLLINWDITLLIYRFQ